MWGRGLSTLTNVPAPTTIEFVSTVKLSARRYQDVLVLRRLILLLIHDAWPAKCISFNNRLERRLGYIISFIKCTTRDR